MKKFLLVVILVLTMCLFLALGASATEYTLVDDLGDPDWYTGNYQLMKDKASKVVLSNGDGTYTAYPAYYILKYSITVKDGAITEAYINGFDYSFVNGKTGKNYSSGAIYKIELPYGLTTIKSDYFGFYPKEANVVELVMSDSITSVATHAFRNDKSSNKLHLKKIVFSKNLTSVGAYAFLKLNTLETVEIPAGTDAVLDLSGAQIFKGCSSLQSLDLSKRNIKALGDNFLEECTSLERLALPDSLEAIGSCSIYKCPKLYLASDFLPASLKTAGFHFLSGCKSINKVLYFPEGFEAFTAGYNFSSDKEIAPDLTLVFLGKVSGTWNFEQFHISKGERKITFIFTKNQFSDLTGKIVQASNDGTLTYIGKTASTDDTDYWVQEGTLTINFGSAAESNSKYKTDENGDTLYYVNTNSYKMFFCGGENVELVYGIRENASNSEWTKPYTTPFVFDRQGHMDAGVHYDLTEVVSLVNCGIDGVTEHTCVLCQRVSEEIVPATGNHNTYEVSPCANKCTVCQLYVQKAEQNHKRIEIYNYEKGFLASGYCGYACENEGCNLNETEEMGAMVIDLGFSVPEVGGFRGINYGYRINRSVISDYERVNEASMSFGVLIATGSNLVKNEKVLDIATGAVHDYIYVVINYGTEDRYDDNDIVIAGYVSEKADGTENRFYFQSSTDKETALYTSEVYGTFYGISYNNLK